MRRQGEQVWDRLVPIVYHELRLLARRQLAREGDCATLVTTELVHEAWLRLADDARVTGSGRNYFFGAAARGCGRSWSTTRAGAGESSEAAVNRM
jgi:hypothetical protein